MLSELSSRFEGQNICMRVCVYIYVHIHVYVYIYYKINYIKTNRIPVNYGQYKVV